MFQVPGSRMPPPANHSGYAKQQLHRPLTGPRLAILVLPSCLTFQERVAGVRRAAF